MIAGYKPDFAFRYVKLNEMMYSSPFAF